MQRDGLEWAYRLAHDPGRFAHRYLLDSPRIVPLLLRERAAISVPSVPMPDGREP
jgi:N-acetylglucosaminyldiphosphoundecaprenol N-acetyl-beta-D-mannosaminyltransferase